MEGNYLTNASDWIGSELPAFVDAFGPPRGSVDRLSVKYLSYTKTEVSSHYHVRKLGLDREGKVRQKIAYWYFD